ncbi:GntR family transcriptional regulator [Sphingomonas sp. RT2P30]|uniref:GntR family transcriptional regulator n=1 Tax=Parasphingomonas halimpatiens TaxID=3096162 RepID=UPI002FCA5DA8
MSPTHAMERSYTMLREMLRGGGIAPGARLDANRLADEIGVSMTPVRDALNRLTGERLVDASSGEGFHAQQLGETELRHLYEWNSAILTMAVRTTPPAALAQAVDQVGQGDSVCDRTSASFDRIGHAVPNSELRAAIHASTIRLHPFRIVEPEVLESDSEELARLLVVDGGQALEIRRYHLRRLRAAGDILRLVNARWSHNTL